MFERGQKVELTLEGLHQIRLNADGSFRTHKDGTVVSATGVVVSVPPRRKTKIVVRLDSRDASHPGEYYDVSLWQPVKQASDHKTCVVCDTDLDKSPEMKLLVRGMESQALFG